MNQDFEEIRSILAKLRSDYVAQCSLDVNNPEAPITERDIVTELCGRLKVFCRSRGYQVHCELKPAPDENVGPEEMKRLARVDVGILTNRGQASWLSEAKKLQGKYRKGSIEARFSCIPVKFFHAVIEVKIQSNVGNAKKDIDKLRKILAINPSCYCCFLLLNARGRPQDHGRIRAYANEKGIPIVEYTSSEDG